jgi:hypothetical protein
MRSFPCQHILAGPQQAKTVLRSDPENLVADAAKTSFACHLSLKAIDDIFATYLRHSEL